jgi:hypothetical protein
MIVGEMCTKNNQAVAGCALCPMNNNFWRYGKNDLLNRLLSKKSTK